MSALDAQARIVQGLSVALPDVSVTGRDPEDLPKPAVVVQDGRAGSSDGVTNIAYVQVKIFHPERDAAELLAQSVRAAVLAMSGHALPDGSGLIDLVQVDSEPVQVFHSSDVTEYVASYRVASRDQ